MFKPLLIAFVLTCVNNSFSQVEEVRKIVQQLCAPEFHGRGYVDGGDSISGHYIANQFKKFGLEEITPNYFQHFSFPVNTFPNKAIFCINKDTLVLGQEIIVDPSSPSYSGEITPKFISPKVIYNQSALVELIQEAMRGESFNALGLVFPEIEKDTLKFVESVLHEIAAYVPIVIVTNKKFTWSVSKNQLRFPILKIQDSIYQQQPITVHLDAKLIENHRTQNVIGFIPAKKRTKKTIVLTAHYDHLGRLGNSTYFPGANDNASGTAMLIHLAHYYAKHPSEYNLLLIAFAGEEIGLLGSKHYVENPLMPLKNIEFLINMDIFGSGEEGITIVNGSVFLNYFDLMQDINDEKQLLNKIKSRGRAANSDHCWFTEAGVKSFFIYTMGPNKNYHDVFDTSKNLSFAEVNDLSTLITTFIARLKTVIPE